MATYTVTVGERNEADVLVDVPAFTFEANSKPPVGEHVKVDGRWVQLTSETDDDAFVGKFVLPAVFVFGHAKAPVWPGELRAVRDGLDRFCPGEDTHSLKVAIDLISSGGDSKAELTDESVNQLLTSLNGLQENGPWEVDSDLDNLRIEAHRYLDDQRKSGA